MPSVTLPTAADKSAVRHAIPNAKIFTAAVARLMVAFPDPEQWSYTGLWGAAALCKENNACYIRLIDIEHHKGVQWEQELDKDFAFVQECPYFYTFDTDDCLAALEFVDASEGAVFYSKLIHRDSIPLRGESTARKTVNKACIGAPADFRHLGHVDDSSGHGIVDQLKALGITSHEITQNQRFIHEFMAKYNDHTQPLRKRAPSSPLPPTPHLQANARQPRSKVPPPLPSRRLSPPPLPSRNAKPKTPSSPPPPPPPPTQHLTPEPPQDGRSDLMASIRHTGGFHSLKQGNRLRSASAHVPPTTTKKESTMASSLAAAIQQRKLAMGDDDESSESDDEWA